MDTKLGTLKNVNLREAWSHEAQDFTPWLADNLDHKFPSHSGRSEALNN